MDIIKLQLDLSKEYGIVLEGGGAKGAYQIGAWRALREAGIRIKGAAGTSVGASGRISVTPGSWMWMMNLWNV